MAVFYDEIPESLFEWIKKQRMFWVATAPLSAQGHINLSPKGGDNCFHVVNSKQVYYQDLTGSGIETISHIRENGRITVMFNAFEGPPRILRLFGIGTVYEYGTPEYHTLIPAETRQPGSRAAIVIDLFQVSTSCGFAVPLYNFVTHRTQLHRLVGLRESVDRDNAILLRDNPSSHPDNVPQNSLRGYWLRKNMKSLDGLPGLLTAPDAITHVVPQHNFDKNTPRPMLQVVRGSKEMSDTVVRGHEKALALGFCLGVITVTAFTQILRQVDLN